MDPRIWGPKLWFVLHTMSFNYPTNPTNIDKQSYHNFFDGLKTIIPCTLCRSHYIEHTTKYPIIPHLNSKQALVKYVIDLHNIVNKSLGKRIYSYDEVIKLYKNYYNTKYKNDDNEDNGKNYLVKYWKTSLFVIIILMCIYFYIKCFKKKKIFTNTA